MGLCAPPVLQGELVMVGSMGSTMAALLVSISMPPHLSKIQTDSAGLIDGFWGLNAIKSRSEE